MIWYVNVILVIEFIWLILCYCGLGNKDCFLIMICLISIDEVIFERDEWYSDVVNVVVGFIEYNILIKIWDMFIFDKWN